MPQSKSSILFWAGGLLCLSLALWTAHGQGTANADQVKRGEYLVRLGSCGDCHTPWKMGANGPEQDSTRLLSGHPQDMVVTAPPNLQQPWMAATSATFTAWAGPWGISFSRNLTPDKETGLGDWTEENFLATIHTGREMGKGRVLLPPMPIPSLQKATDDDLRAIFAYLQSIPSIQNKVPEPVPPAAAPGSEQK